MKTQHILDVKGGSDLVLTDEFLESLKDLPKCEHYTSPNYEGCQKKTKQMFPRNVSFMVYTLIKRLIAIIVLRVGSGLLSYLQNHFCHMIIL
jgi:hypothetical protein